MVAADEDALTCDFAETYHILNWRGLPARYAAVLACGLRENSRIRMVMSGQKQTAERILQAAGVDALNMLVWMQTKDAAKNWNRPKSILKEMLEDPDVPEIVAFESGEAFEKERQAIIEGVA